MNIQDNKSEFELIKDTVFFWLKHWYYFVISMAICLALAYIYLQVKTPVLKVMAQVSLRTDESLSGAPSVSRNQSLLSAFGIGRSSINIEDESIKMNSQGYVKKIVQKYSLNFDYKQIKFFGFSKTNLYDRSPVILSASKEMLETIPSVAFKINIKKDKTLISMEQGRETLGKYEITTFPSNLDTPLGSFTVSKSEFYDTCKKPMKIDVFCANSDVMAQIYRGAIIADFEKKTSDLINLSMNSENPELSKKILNEIIDIYNAEWEADKNLVTGKTMAYIEERLKATHEELFSADKAIQNFKDRYNLTDIEADVTYYFTLSGELQPGLIETESQLKMIDLIVAFVTDEKNKYSLFPVSPNLATPAMVEIISKYNEALIKRNEINISELQSPLVRNYNAQVEFQRETLLMSIDNLKKSLQITLGDLKKKESEIKNKIGKIPEIENSYIKLRREQELQQTIYIFLLEMLEQTGVKGVLLLPKLKVIDEPYVAIKLVEPNFMKVAITALFFGGFILPLSAIYGFPLIGSYLRKRKEK